MAMALEDVSTLVTCQIVTGENNEVFHMDWDNLNNVTTNIHGNNVVNHTGRIMIQEVKRGIDVNATIQERTLPFCNRADSRHFETKVTEKIPPFQIYKKIGSKFPDTATYNHLDINKAIYDKCLKKMHRWFLARSLSSCKQKQSIPAFGGFISAAKSISARKSTKDYFTPRDQPFTDFGVVRELLKRSEKLQMK